MIINTNVNSLNAQRHLAGTTSRLQTATERLSSGLRINKAADDAAGMAIADRMTAQIRGFNQARRNANDGISLVQTAEGAIIQLTNYLQRMRELSVQAANDTNQPDDRKTIQKEIIQLKNEITRIANTTQFNRRDLLNGKFSAQQLQVGANAAQTISIDMNDARGQSIGNNRVVVDGVEMNVVDASNKITDLKANGGEKAEKLLKIYGRNSDPVDIKLPKAASMESLAELINNVSGRTGVNARARTDMVLDGFEAERNYTIGLRGLGNTEVKEDFGDPALDPKYTINFKVDKEGGLSQAVEQINAKTETTGIKAQLDINNPKRLILSSESGKDIVLSTYSAVKFDGTKVDVDITATQIRSFQRIEGYVEIDDGSSIGSKGNKASTVSMKFKAGQAAAAQPAGGTGGAPGVGAGTGGGDAGGGADGAKAAAAPKSGSILRVYGSIDIFSEESFELKIKKDDGKDLEANTVTLLGTVGGAAGEIRQISLLNTVDELDVSTRNGANDAIRVIDAALSRLDSLRADLGAIQNRLVGTISNLRVAAENLSAARSRIQDSDYAEETAELTSASILQQAGTAMLAQANQQPQLALQLLQR